MHGRAGVVGEREVGSGLASGGGHGRGFSRILAAVPVVHQALGGFVVAINLVAGIWGLLIWRGRLTAGRAFEQVLALSHTVIFGQAVLGLLLLAGKYRAPVQLHYVYGLAPGRRGAVRVLVAHRGHAPQHPRLRRSSRCSPDCSPGGPS